ncbi:MAG: TonB-dependent receptor [Cyclobacteriaceae bacterium]
MKKKYSHYRYLVLIPLMLYLRIASAQDSNSNKILVSGTVTDEQGEALIGVTVLLKGTMLGTTTDIEGNYSLKAPIDATITFSYVGFQNIEIPIDGQTEINTSLIMDTDALDEIVVVGTSLKKSDLTGSVVSVNSKTLEERPVTNINDALQGRAAGVFIQNNPTPGGYASIRIRGNNSIQYGGNPIFVVDGIIMDNDFNLINLNDVASINVLKDASATALYGSRGANGVVVVTTKKGKKGEGQLNYKTWVGFSSFINEDLTLGASDMYQLRIDALANSSIAANYFSQYPNAPKEEFINSQLIGDNSAWFADYERNSMEQGRSYDWLREVSRDQAVQQNHSASFSGGSENSSFFASFGYIDEEGLIENSSSQRITGRLNVEQSVKSNLKVGSNTAFTRLENQEVDGSVFSVARAANPLLPIGQYGDTLFLAWGDNWDINSENPLNSLNIRKDRIVNKFSSSNYIDYSPIPGLSMRTTFAVDISNQEYYEYTPRGIQQALRDSYLGRAIHNFDKTTYYQWDNSISYKSSFGKHNYTVLLATSLSRDEFNYTNLSARDFPTDNFSYYDLGGAFDKPNFNLGSDFSAATLMSYLARVNYNFDNKYFVTATARYDGSSKFAEGYKWGLFPSLALSWDMTSEGFMQSQSFFDMLKLRAGYGSVGNQTIPNFAFLSLYRPAFANETVSFNSTGLRGTEALTWESQRQLNVGIDLSMLNSRVQFTAEYFNIVNSNLLMRRTLSTLTGYNEAIENIGELTNRGFELSASAILVDKSNFKWDISANLSRDQNRVTQLFQDVDAIFNFGGFTGTEIQRTGNLFLGESLNSIYMWEFDRIIQPEDMEYVNSLQLPGKTLRPGDILPRDQQAPGEPGHGIIDEDDRVIVGTQDPKFYGGFSSRASWKGLSLNTVFTYSYGAKRISGFYEQLMAGTGFGPAHNDMLNRWSPTNTDTNIPRATYDNAARFTAGETSWGIQDASFVRLATITLSYTLPKLITNTVGVGNARIYASGNNLVTWTKYKGYDPENGDFYPTSRMLVFGADISF